MNKNRVYNFSAGPSMLAESVLENINAQLMNYHESGMSVMEMSHRSSLYMDLFQETKELLEKVMKIPDNYEVLLMHGGATQQFSSVPLNLGHNQKADYIVTGVFSNKAKKQAENYLDVHVAYDGKNRDYKHIPTQDELEFSQDASYVHICENNTIYGTKWNYIPDTKGIPLVADMSSCLLSEPIDVSKYGLIYAGAQKNMGIAGLCVVIINKDLIQDVSNKVPPLMNYKMILESDSMYNTPNTFAIYVLGEVLKWIDRLGGLEVMKIRNQAKAQFLYDYLDSTDFYQTHSDKNNRSMMNVTFQCATKELDQKFVEEASQIGLVNLKGHRLVGGIRASIYNAMPLTGVYELVTFMKKFANENR